MPSPMPTRSKKCWPVAEPIVPNRVPLLGGNQVYPEENHVMAMKMNAVGLPKTSANLAEDKLGCWRLWMRPRTSRKEARKRGHMMLGLYSVNPKK